MPHLIRPADALVDPALVRRAHAQTRPRPSSEAWSLSRALGKCSPYGPYRANVHSQPRDSPYRPPSFGAAIGPVTGFRWQLFMFYV